MDELRDNFEGWDIVAATLLNINQEINENINGVTIQKVNFKADILTEKVQIVVRLKGIDILAKEFECQVKEASYKSRSGRIINYRYFDFRLFKFCEIRPEKNLGA